MFNITAAVVTLGCRLNQADSALICDRLQKCGFKIVSESEEENPSLIVLNTCSVTATAAKKTKQTLRQLRSKNPYAYIIMTGCTAELEKNELSENADFDVLLTEENKQELESILERRFNIPPYIPPETQNDKSGVFFEHANSVYPFKTRANLKIQQGCNNFCSYCIVPYARGRERSRDLNETMDDFKQLLDTGFREIVLTGVNTCSYRCGNTDLVGLLEKMVSYPGQFRIRLSSTEPGEIVSRLVDCMAAYPEKICAFLHLPAQSGNDTILKAMNRKYTCAQYAELTAMAREKIPHIHIGSDWIIGFPGETETLFRKSCEFMESQNFANLHVFPFSPRKGTAAEKLPGRVGVSEMAERMEQARVIKKNGTLNFAKSLINTDETVLVERRCSGTVYEGFSSNYARIRFCSRTDVTGQLVKLKVTSVKEEEGVIIGKIVSL